VVSWIIYDGDAGEKQVDACDAARFKEGAAVTGRAPQQEVETATVTTTTTTTAFSLVPSRRHEHGINWYYAWFELHHVKENPTLACLAV
jgi:hypothetical protein